MMRETKRQRSARKVLAQLARETLKSMQTLDLVSKAIDAGQDPETALQNARLLFLLEECEA